MAFIQADFLISRILDAALSPEKIRVVALDVRSEGEFSDGSIPGSENLPILTNEERHQVGITYKQQGQEAAIRLGHELVDPQRDVRVAEWVKRLGAVPEENRFVFCWRGGLRSKLATEWIRAAGVRVPQVEGGYKAIRKLLLDRITTITGAREPFLVVSGTTGSGKTELLRNPEFPFFDLEKHANHRGSSFGLTVNGVQPRQATFENRMGLDLLTLDRRWGSSMESGTYLAEDESPGIGKCWIPNAIQDRTSTAPIIILEEPMEARAARIEEEYVVLPLREGVAVEILQAHLTAQLVKLQKRMGHERATRILRELTAAFSSDFRVGRHHGWITMLLAEYYDPGYTYYFSRFERKSLFKGSLIECREWIREWIRSGRKV